MEKQVDVQQMETGVRVWARRVGALLVGALCGLAQAEGLPEGYEAVDYLESTGTQWINPAYNLAANTKIEVSFGHLVYGSYKTLFGGSIWGNGAALFNMRSTTQIGYLRNNDVVNFAYNFSAGDDCSLTIVSSDTQESTFRNNTTGETQTFAGKALSNNAIGKAFYIFAPSARTANAAAWRLYSMKLSNGAALIRDLQPARRRADGELGLYDLVGGTFYTNAGTGRFRTRSTTGHRLTYIRSIQTYPVNDYCQKINDFWTTTTDFTFDFWFGDPINLKNGNESVPSAFVGEGVWNTGSFLINNNGTANLNFYGVSSSVKLGSDGQVGSGAFHFLLDNTSGSASCEKNGSLLNSSGANDKLKTPSGKPLAIFGLRNKGTSTGNGYIKDMYGYSVYSFYGIKITDVVDHEFVPYMTSDGAVAVADAAQGYQFFPATPVSISDYGLPYDLVNGAAQFFEGVFTAQDLQALDSGAVTYSSFEKTTDRILTTAAVESFKKPVLISAGTWSLIDGRINVQSLPALQLAGGTTLAFDLDDTSCDSLAPERLTLTATTDNKVKIDLAAKNPDWNTRFTLISQGLQPGDEAKFELADPTAFAGLTFSVEDGALILTYTDPTPVTAKWQQRSDMTFGWVCYNLAGTAVDTTPQAGVTELVIPAGTTMFSGLGTLPPHRGGLVFEPSESGAFELCSDTDLSALDLTQIAADQTICLKGYTLTIQSESDTEHPVLSFVESEANFPGRLVWTVPAGTTSTNAVYRIKDKIKIEKHGAGTLVLARPEQNLTGSILVAAGCFQLGATIPTAFQTTTVTVKSGAKLDLSPCGANAVPIDTLTLEGGAVIGLAPGTVLTLSAWACNLDAVSSDEPVIIQYSQVPVRAQQLTSSAAFNSASAQKFTFEPTGDYVINVRDGDLWVASTESPLTMEWLNDAWVCKNSRGLVVSALPDETVTQLRLPTVVPTNGFSEAVSLLAITAQDTTMPLELSGDTDWRGLDIRKFDANLVIDLKGHTLTLTGVDGTFNSVFTVTDSSAAGAGGSLILNVPEGESMINAGIELTGSLKFVKAGAGSFKMTKSPQTYTGGTLVAGGLLDSIARSGESDLSHAPHEQGFKPFGPVSTVIEIGPGGTFDIGGNYCYSKHAFVLSGGTLMNSVTQGTAHKDWLSLGDLTLTADSKLVSLKGTHLGAVRSDNMKFVADLGGHVLDIEITAGDFHEDTLHLLNYAFINGTVRVVKGGWFQVWKASDSWTNTTFDFQSGALAFENDFTVKNLTLRATTDNDTGWNKRGTGRLTITGTYTPITDYYHNFTLRNGATIDLTQHEIPFVIAPAYTLRTENGQSTFTFEDGGQFLLTLKSIPPTGTKIIDWTEQVPPNWQTLRFATRQGQFEFYPTEEGVFIRSGFTIILR